MADQRLNLLIASIQGLPFPAVPRLRFTPSLGCDLPRLKEAALARYRRAKADARRGFGWRG